MTIHSRLRAIKQTSTLALASTAFDSMLLAIMAPLLICVPLLLALACKLQWLVRFHKLACHRAQFVATIIKMADYMANKG